MELAATNEVPNAMMEIFTASKKPAMTELEIPEKTNTANKPQPTEEVQVKAIDLGTGDNSKTTTSAHGSTRNRKMRSSTSFGLTETSSCGSQRICQGCPRG
jgi:hypothetical protein